MICGVEGQEIVIRGHQCDLKFHFSLSIFPSLFVCQWAANFPKNHDCMVFTVSHTFILQLMMTCQLTIKKKLISDVSENSVPMLCVPPLPSPPRAGLTVDLCVQVLDPTKRLGCDECGGYRALKEHSFYEGV